MEPINRVSNGEVRRIYCARVQHSGVFFFSRRKHSACPEPIRRPAGAALEIDGLDVSLHSGSREATDPCLCHCQCK